jgi:6-pyruvoyltetrahydropterin/6-carboxytetrahydropterin synthase
MQRLSTIELYKETMTFAAAHFTMFSATQRETLHGHNYKVYCALTTLIGAAGINFDYRYYRKKLIQLCQQLNHLALLPTQSPFLTLQQEAPYIYAHFNNDAIPFLQKDVKLLNITNVTTEELSQWFLKQLMADNEDLTKHDIQRILIKVSSSPGQYASASWEKDDDHSLSTTKKAHS